jgi:hypothetical protein
VRARDFPRRESLEGENLKITCFYYEREREMCNWIAAFVSSANALGVSDVSCMRVVNHTRRG